MGIESEQDDQGAKISHLIPVGRPFPERRESGGGGDWGFWNCDFGFWLRSRHRECARTVDWRTWESLLEWGELHVLSTYTGYVRAFGVVLARDVDASRDVTFCTLLYDSD
jgi:hypothetical protein